MLFFSAAGKIKRKKKDDAYFCLVNNLNSNIPLLGVFYICLQAVTVMT